MKKIYLSIILSMLALIGMQAQTTIFSDNIDSYTVGGKLADQAGEPWTTWSNNPGSSEDPTISDDQSYSPNNSAHIQSGNDAILLLGDSVTGRYLVSFNIYIPAGKLGYYNLLADFAGSDSEWATQVFFDEGGNGSIDAGVQGAATFTYEYDSWIYVENYVDLDNNWAEVFIDGEYLVSWQWTSGTFGGPVSNKLSAANFFAWDGSKAPNGTPEFFLDDILYQSMPLGEAPSNLEVDVNNSTVTLTWDAPVDVTPFTYYIFRNGDLAAISPDLTLVDEIEYPGTFTYEVKAYYTDLGLSRPTNDVEVIIEGGVERNKVILEIATGTWCGFCPGAAMGANDLVENGHEVAVIEYHYGDAYENTESMDRIGYYGISGYPTSIFDGLHGFSGGSADESLYEDYLPFYNERMAISSIFDLEINATYNSNGSFDVVIDVEQLWAYSEFLQLRLALTESHIPENWLGLDELDFVLREFYPNTEGIALDLQNVGDTHQENYTITVPANYDITHCELVAFVQNDNTREIMNGAKLHLGQLVGVEEHGDTYTRVYPNPASGFVNIESASKMKHISIFTLNGQKVYDVALDQNNVNLNIDFLNQGIYMMEINTDNGRTIEKLNVR